MTINERIEAFVKLEPKAQLEAWHELQEIGHDFLETAINDKILGKLIAEAILFHRSLMASSKAYEQALEIDSHLLFLSIQIARIAYGQSVPLIDFLKAGIYYSEVLPTRFDKVALEKEIKEIIDKK